MTIHDPRFTPLTSDQQPATPSASIRDQQEPFTIHDPRFTIHATANQPPATASASTPNMSGSLHIFRREVVSESPSFQINYNLAGRSFAKVVDGDHDLNEFLEVTAALPGDVVEAAWKQLDATGSANVVEVDIPESHAISNGMKVAPTDF